LRDRRRNVVDMDLGDKSLRERVEIELDKELVMAALLSDWEAKSLLPIQYDYAASESMVLVELFRLGVEVKR